MIDKDGFTFWTDGSVGPKRYKRAGSAFALLRGDTLILGLQCIKNRNIAEAEWNAVLIAMEYAFANQLEHATIYTDQRHRPRTCRDNAVGKVIRTVQGHESFKRSYKVEYAPHPDDVWHPGGVAHFAARYAVQRVEVGPMEIYEIPRYDSHIFHKYLPKGQNWRLL